MRYKRLYYVIHNGGFFYGGDRGIKSNVTKCSYIKNNYELRRDENEKVNIFIFGISIDD